MFTITDLRHIIDVGYGGSMPYAEYERKATMKATIIFGSPRKKGNTMSLLIPFMDELEKAGVSIDFYDVYEKDIAGCRVCKACQKDKTRAYCVIADDMTPVLESIAGSDLLIVAAPVYSFGLPGPVKTAFDRCIYPFLKYYGDDLSGPSLFEGKTLALIMTSGYPVDMATGMIDESMRLIAKHSKLAYKGVYGERQRSYSERFMDEEKEARARRFARELAGQE